MKNMVYKIKYKASFKITKLVFVDIYGIEGPIILVWSEISAKYQQYLAISIPMP